MVFPRDKGGSFWSGRGEMDSKRGQPPPQGKGRVPRLDRRNAAKNIDYDAGATVVSVLASWSSSSSSDDSPGLCATGGSMDLSPSSYSNQTSFRIGGSVEGEVDLLCRSLGLSGPDDFAIPLTAWEARKGRSSSDILPRSRPLDGDSPAPKDPTSAPNSAPPDPPAASRDTTISRPHEVEEEDGRRRPPDTPVAKNTVTNDEPVKNSPSAVANGAWGIRGVRPPILATPAAILTLSPPPAPGPSPPVLAPPPSISLPAMDKGSSTWDIVRSFAPDDGDGGYGAGGERRRSFDSEDEGDRFGGAVEVEFGELRLGQTCEEFSGTSSLSTTNDDDASSTTTETMFIVSPNGRFKKSIKSWMRGMLLGSGSFGTVYEGISDDGVFFAVKEVSLLDQGKNAQQCIFQLEQEIALLSQFEHENIVQYYGTDKEEAKLFIFLELVTQGSLASLYQKYHLRDTIVSAYTRQILNGLKYLHDRNVVHRDIKCANILVHANGSVKLADFGLAKEMTKFNVLKSCKGSVYWMAPEVVHPKTTYGPPADIWSLGCTVLEMLTRQLPYPNLEWTQALFKIGRGEPPPIPNSLSRDAREFISRCVKVNPDDRPSASELLEHPFLKRSLSASSGSDSSLRGNDRWS